MCFSSKSKFLLVVLVGIHFVYPCYDPPWLTGRQLSIYLSVLDWASSIYLSIYPFFLGIFLCGLSINQWLQMFEARNICIVLFMTTPQITKTSFCIYLYKDFLPGLPPSGFVSIVVCVQFATVVCACVRACVCAGTCMFLFALGPCDCLSKCVVLCK